MRNATRVMLLVMAGSSCFAATNKASFAGGGGPIPMPPQVTMHGSADFAGGGGPIPMPPTAR